MEAWCPIATQLVTASLAPRTQRAYEAAWREYSASVEPSQSGELFKSTGVLRFLAMQWGKGKSLALIKRQLSAIAYFAGLRGGADPTKNFQVRMAVKGWQRLRPPAQDSRRPVDPARLGGILRVLGGICFSELEIRLFSLAYALAFFGAFRVSELVADTANGRPGGLRVTDITLAEDALLIVLRRSKTDQTGRGVLVRLAAAPGASCCPVHLARLYLEVRPRGEHHNLLIHANGTPLTRGQFSRILRRAVLQLGEDPAGFTSHSFRIGAATTAASMDLPAESIKGLGRWKSGCFKRYVRPQLL